MSPNLKAFLDMIAFSEGTANVTGSDDGYNVLVTGIVPAGSDVTDLGGNRHIFNSYADHPNVLVQVTPHLLSTAAGRYQQMHHDWPIYKQRLALPDFGPASQDILAGQHIIEARALGDVEAGNIVAAIHKCANIWASFPGNAYGQRQRNIDDLLEYFAIAGGTIS